jgi:hypothetical protein|tara:strand:+ start:118 stop:345 length:228 start_codon:yes stop_codon:yes gene_type:complete
MSNEKNSEKIQLIEGWSFNRINYIIFFIGVLFIVFGYIIMATGTVNSFQSLTLAPIMLFLGYIILIPASLIYRGD